MNRLQLIVIVFFITSFTAFGQTNIWNLLNEKDYSIQYPKKWQLNKSGIMGSRFILLSQLTSDTDKFKENVNLIIQDLTGYNIDLDKYVEISEGQIKTMIIDGNIISSNRIKNEKTEFQRVIYTGKQGAFNLKFEQYYWVQNNKAYVLTLTCEANQFNDFKDTGEKILNSFKIK
ncbi:hypothetical protein [Tenacibaculum sp. UWU-22]|uniref:PsbP-related protein n=1 Tax=Tenacibaculum sp. UWU-22 TaxID=3234187 RepID=UPI0034DAE004